MFFKTVVDNSSLFPVIVIVVCVSFLTAIVTIEPSFIAGVAVRVVDLDASGDSDENTAGVELISAVEAVTNSTGATLEDVMAPLEFS